MSNFSFNNIEKDYCYYTDYTTSWGQDREINTTDVQGRSGTVLTSVRDKIRKIEVKLLVDSLEVGESLEHIAEDLTDWLTTDEPKPITFAREPDRIYYGILEGTIDKDYFVNFGKATVNFLCVDPYKYAREKTKQTAISDQASLYNAGTKDTPLIIQARALEPSSHFMIAKGYNNDSDEFFMIGDDDVTKDIENYYPSIYHTEFQSFTGWNKMVDGNIPDRFLGGEVGGNFEIANIGESFKVSDFPDGSGWVGAGTKRSLPRTAQDWQITYKLLVEQGGLGAGRTAQHIYDTDNRLIASIGYENVYHNRKSGHIVATLFNQNGDHRKIYDHQNAPFTRKFDRMVVYMRLRRKGKNFQVKTWKYDHIGDPSRTRPVDVHIEEFTDGGEFYQRPIGAISIYSAKYSGYDWMEMNGLGSFNTELLPKKDGTRDMIIQKGDDVKIDTQNNTVVVNEEPVLNEKTFASDFFNIESGLNEMIIMPENTFDTTFYWRDRYL
ncbi:distal tail protein Dit [Staphylococcus arlettae]